MTSDDHDDDGDDGSNRRTRSREALRETVIQAGLELLAKHGLTLTYQSISYTKVFAYLEDEYSIRITRGSVHERIWANQEDFRRDVIAESVRFFEEGQLNRALLTQATEASGPDQFARSVGSRLYPKIVGSQSFGQFQSIKALASRLDDLGATELIHRFLDTRAERALADNRENFSVLLRSLGLRPRSSLGLTQDQSADLFRILMAGLTDGGELNRLAGAADVSGTIAYLSTPPDATDPWRPVSIGVKAFLDFLFEPDDQVHDVAPSTLTPPSQQESRAELVDESLLAAPQRRSRTRLKKLVLTAAVELLLQDGLNLKPESLGYSTVFAHIQETRGERINRASVHGRIWASNDDYRAEVLSRSINPEAREFVMTSDAMQDMPPVLAADGSVDRQATKNEYIRGYGHAIPTAGANTRRTLVQVKSALIDQQETPISLKLRAAVQRAENERVRRNKIEFRYSIVELGFRAKPENGLSEDEALELLLLLSMTTLTGLTLNRLAGIGAVTRLTPIPIDALDGDRADWEPAAIALRCFMDQLYEEVDTA